jgi:RmlD substrate binding domain
VRLYVFGAEGQVARSLREAATGSSNIEIGFSSRSNVDIRRADLVEKAIAEFSPTIVINPAAYTAVHKPKPSPTSALQSTAPAPASLRRPQTSWASRSFICRRTMSSTARNTTATLRATQLGHRACTDNQSLLANRLSQQQINATSFFAPLGSTPRLAATLFAPSCACQLTAAGCRW